MYPSFILDRAKGFVHESASANAFSNTTLIRFLNDEVRSLTSEVRRRFPLFGMTETTISQTSGTDGSDLPTRLDRVIDLRREDATNEQVYPADHASNLGQGFALTDTQFYWVNDDETHTYYLRYTRLPWDVHRGVAQALSDATHLTLADASLNGVGGTTWGDVPVGAVYDDYFNGAKLIVTSCTTAANIGQEVTINDHVGSTGVLTVSAWPIGKPDGTVVYQIQPLIDPKEWNEVLAWGVANRVRAIGRGDPLMMSGAHPYRKARRAFFSHWRDIYGTQGKPVHYVALELQA